MRYLRLFLQLVRVKFGSHIPIKVFHFITNRCNLNCSYCLAKNLEKNRQSELNTDEIISLMLKFKKIGTVFWVFTGGEPMLRKDLPILAGTARDLGFIVGLDSNGYGIPENIDMCRKIDHIQISIDGPMEYHDSIRGNGAYEQLIMALESLNHEGIKCTLNCVVNKKNIQYVDYISNLADKYHTYLDFTPEIPENGLLYSRTDIIEMNILYDLLRREKKKYSSHITFLPYIDRLRRYQNGEIKRFFKRCNAGKTFCTLSPEGTVHHCFLKMSPYRNTSGAIKKIEEQFRFLETPDCDCCFRCYYKLNNLYILDFKPIYIYIKQVLLSR